MNCLLQRENVSKDYTSRVGHYFNTLWNVSKGADGTELQRFIPNRHYTRLMIIYEKDRRHQQDHLFK